ncbi:MAG: hypothetical protein ACKOQ6_10665 [Bacteroidota bacterium]
MTPGLTNRNFARLLYLGDADFFGELVIAHLKMIGNLQVDATTSCDNLLTRLDRADILVVEDGLQDCKVDELLTVIHLRSSKTPVLVLSADYSSELRLKLLLLGATDVIARDEHTCEVLEAQVRRLIDQVELQTALDNYMNRAEGVSIGQDSPSLEGVTIPNDSEHPLEVYTMAIIRHFLGKYNNNVVLVARKLGVGKSTIYRYLKENKLTLSGEPSVLRKPVDAMANEVASHQMTPLVPASYADTHTTFKPSVAPVSLSNQLLDLKYLHRISRGDQSFTTGMMNVFFRTMETLIPRLREQHAVNDREGMLRSLGSMKTPLESMGMSPAKRAVDRVEKDILQGFSPVLIARQMEDLFSILDSSLQALRNHR